jgi:hypothetical protein
MVLATTIDLGSHYSLARVERVVMPWRSEPYLFQPGSAKQLLWLAVLPQLCLWPMVTFAVAGAAMCLADRALDRSGFRRASSTAT